MMKIKQLFLEKKAGVYKRLISTILALALCLGMIPMGLLSVNAEPTPKGYMVLSVEKFVIGTGWIYEPQMVPFYEGDYAGNVITRALGGGMVTDGSNGMGNVVENPGSNLSYINRVRDNDLNINPPQYVKDYLGWPFKSGRSYEGWLGQFDYNGGSGWVYTRNNVFPNIGLGACTLENNLVIRLQFTLYNGDKTGSSGLSVNRDTLARRLAFINSSDEKESMLENEALKAAYDSAKEIFSDLTKTQEEINDALTAINSAMPGSVDLFLEYDLNGGTGSVVDNKTYTEGSEAILASEKEISHPEDKDFANWNTKADATGEAYLPNSSILFKKENITLYAIWDTDYKVKYDANVENGGGESVVPVDASSYLPGRIVSLKAITSANSKQETGLVFKEWNTKADGSGAGFTSTGKMTMPRNDITLYAIWTKGYRIIYNGNGHTKGTVPATTAYYLPGASVTINNNSTLYKNNQRAAWWNTNALGTGDTYKFSQSIKMPENDIYLYAFYRDTFNVSYDLNGGEGTAPTDATLYLPGARVSLKSGTDFKTADGKLFKEWNSQPDGNGISYTAAFNIEMEDILLYAIYADGFSVSYDLNGGTGTVPVDTKRYISGALFYTKTPSPALGGPNGTVQGGWNTKADGTGTSYKISNSVVMGEEDLVLYAVYIPTYTIAYDLNGGISGKPNTTTGHKTGDYVYLKDAKNGQMASASATHPVGQEGMVFKGWSLDKDDPEKAIEILTSMPGEDITLYAIWTPGLAIKFDLNGGEGTTPVDEKLYLGNRQTYLTTPVSTGITAPEGLAFYQWNTKADGTGNGYNAKAGVYLANSAAAVALEPNQTVLTFYAIYKEQYQLNYNTNGGSAVPSSALIFNGNTATITNTAPTKAGVTFRYWNTKADGSGIDYKAGEKIQIVDGDLTLYARWSANNVYYDVNGGSGDAPQDGKRYTPNMAIKASPASGLTAPLGQRFIAWNTKADGTGTFVSPGEEIRIARGDFTLYAIWRDESADNELALHLAKLLEAVPAPTVGTLAGEWSVLALARAGYDVPANYYSDYYLKLASILKANNGALDKTKYTEYSRVILALSAIGYDVTNVAGYNLLTYLSDMDKISFQGINGPIFALLALDSKDYSVSTNTTAQTQVTREKLIEAILDREIEGGGWSLMGDEPDSDITAMVLQALAPYKDSDSVKDYVERGVKILSQKQDSSGRFGSIDGVCAESTAQVIIALTALGINPKTDSRFVKSDGNTISGLMMYALAEGGFEHILGGKIDTMATDQGILGLIAYERFVNSQKSLYDMTDVTAVQNPDYVEPEKKDVTLTDENKTGITVTAKEGVFPSGTELWVDPISSGSKFDKANAALKDKNVSFKLFDIFLLKNNEEIQPDGIITISIPVPADFDSTKCKVYRINDDGTVTDMKAILKDGFLVFETDHLSLYSVAQTVSKEESKPTPPAPTGEGRSDAWVLIGGCSLLALVVISQRKKVKK